MLSPEQLLSFLAVAVVVTLSPGPDNLMVLGLGMAKGRLRGMIFGLGCALGCLTHTALAALGVSALIAASATAFTVLKIVGGLYLIWLGIQALRSTGQPRISCEQPDEPLGRLFLKGLFANAINPKVVLFFLSFLPQFVLAERGHVSLQILQLGVVCTLQAAILFGLLGYFSGAVGQWLQRKPRLGLWLDRMAGGIFVGLGVKLMVSR
ncbi:threonine/homoserine/homoserine lactone efflux protein [Pseudomonas duriflava]|uniref:Threonine/homoserine/homoserine lactone efflux protein n=1 Tax=Pseudomonas duriflava TaxID=459528 RepID=A0A562QFP2_9PSED|nr:LysE family translocator [Pseudomonas duriflava]TWI54990.1 threonine/homoserine/homoserine lactone efflux protein [Pseudomonas duriflava]